MITVTLQPAGIQVTSDGAACIVDTLRRAGVRSPYKCRRGGCGACKCRLVSGTVDYPTAIAQSVLSSTERETGHCLPCRAVPTSDVVLNTGDRDIRRLLATTTTSPA